MSDSSSKKRLALTITSMCVAVVAVICSVVAIFAAANQGVQSTFKVTYKATNVAATVSAEYTVKNESAKSLGSVTIDAAADETTYEDLATDEDIPLSAKNNEVVFKYTFQNDSDTKDFTVTLADNAVKENVSVQYAYADATSTDALTYSSRLGGTEEEPSYTVTVEKSKTVNVYIKVTISNTANDASYESKENNYLAWELVAI